jgi:hypothetical protein
MYKTKIIIFVTLIYLLFSCKKEELKSSEAKLISYSLANSPAIIDETKKEISINLPPFTDISQLVASFQISPGASLLVGNTLQINNITANNFSSTQILTIKAENGTFINYTLKVIVGKSNEANLLSFDFKKALNASFSTDIIGCKKSNNFILNTLGFDLNSDNLLSLTPSFTISKGAKLLINGVEFQSEKTTQKFSDKPIEVSIVAQDGSIQKYSIAVTSQILNIETFLSICPISDPAFTQIVKDFEFRKNGKIVNMVELSCTDKSSRLNRLLQTLRVYYYIDLYKTKGYLPFTKLRLYEWLKAEVKGFDISDELSASGACCLVDQNKKFILLSSGLNESAAIIKFDYTQWQYLAGYFTLIGHERRHADPTSYPHTGNCNNVVGDADYNEANLGAYGVAYWLSKAFKTGVLEVGIGCLSDGSQAEINNLTGENGWAARYFCKNAPPISWAPKYAVCSCK